MKFGVSVRLGLKLESFIYDIELQDYYFSSDLKGVKTSDVHVSSVVMVVVKFMSPQLFIC